MFSLKIGRRELCRKIVPTFLIKSQSHLSFWVVTGRVGCVMLTVVWQVVCSDREGGLCDVDCCTASCV